MRIWFFTTLTLGTLGTLLSASPITSQLIDVQGSHATIQAENLREGMSGLVLREFDATHGTIISNAYVETLNTQNNRAILRLTPYDGLHQDNLPTGKWTPAPSDKVVLAYDYNRALLIAPNDESYKTVTENIPTLEWIHPDNFATYLSHEGHPTPLQEDFHQYCTANSIGLLYIQSANTLFTLDCKTLTLLQHSPSLQSNQMQPPFYSRIPKIRAAWWGEGSSRLDTYEPYYLQMIALKNSKNKELYELYKAKFSEKSALLRHFDIKE